MTRGQLAFLAIIVVAAVLAAAGCGQTGVEAGGTVTVTVAQTVTVGGDTTAPPTTEANVTDTEPSDTDTAASGSEGSPVLTVDKSGWSVDPDIPSYALQVTNESTGEDALEIEATVNILSGDDVIATDTQYLNVIPAGATVFIVGNPSLEANAKITGLDPIVEYLDSAPAQYPLPKIENVRVIPDVEFGSVDIRGQVENNLEGRLSDFAQINAAAFDADGSIAGGCFTYLSNSLPPGRKAGFSCVLYTKNAGKVESAQATMDNELGE